jgi:hypothetical protein
LLAKSPEDRPAVDSALAMLRAGTRTMTATTSTAPEAPDTSVPPAPEPMSWPLRIGLMLAGAVLLLAGALIAIGVTVLLDKEVIEYIMDELDLYGQRGQLVFFVYAATMAALAALLSGAAATFFRWQATGRPPFATHAIVFAVAFSVLFPLWLTFHGG